MVDLRRFGVGYRCPAPPFEAQDNRAGLTWVTPPPGIWCSNWNVLRGRKGVACGQR